MDSKRTLQHIIKVLKQYEPELRSKYGIKRIGVFGSLVRGEADRESDLDLLVEFDEDVEMELLRFVEIERQLGELLGRKVDLVEKDVLKPFIGQHILREVVYP